MRFPVVSFFSPEMNPKTTPELPTAVSILGVLCLGSIMLQEGLWGDVGVKGANEVMQHFLSGEKAPLANNTVSQKLQQILGYVKKEEAFLGESGF